MSFHTLEKAEKLEMAETLEMHQENGKLRLQRQKL